MLTLQKLKRVVHTVGVCIATNLSLCTHRQCKQHASVFTVCRYVADTMATCGIVGIGRERTIKQL